MENNNQKEPQLVASAVPIKSDESVFWQNANATKERDQLDENLRENVGLLQAATHIMDNVNIIDPAIYGRVINIFEQLRALTQAVTDRIEYNRTRPNI